jgi:hypothetical protein
LRHSRCDIDPKRMLLRRLFSMRIRPGTIWHSPRSSPWTTGPVRRTGSLAEGNLGQRRLADGFVRAKVDSSDFHGFTCSFGCRVGWHGSQRPTRLERLGRPIKGEVVEKKEPRPWVDFSGPMQKRDTFRRSKGTGIRSGQSSEASSAWWPNLKVALALPRFALNRLAKSLGCCGACGGVSDEWNW